MKKISRFECIFIALIASQTFFAGLLYAENIKIPVGSQMPELDNTARPKTGMTKTSVKNQFGEPGKVNPAKGQPPISSWEYTNFIVYFESDHVIHSVLKPKLHESRETVIEETVEMKEEDLELN